MKAEVQLNETTTNTSAMKKMPQMLEAFALLSSFELQEAGRVISKAPSSEIPKIRKMANTNRLKPTLVDMLYMVVSLNSALIRTPTRAKIPIMDSEYTVALRK